MKKPLPFLLMLGFLLVACSFPQRRNNLQSSPTPRPSTTPTLSPTPVSTFTSTPTSTPLPTPTPVPGMRIAAGDQSLFYGDWESALTAYQDAFYASSEDETEAAALLGIGRVYYLSGDYASALSALRDLIENYPDTPQIVEANFFLGQTYEALDRFSEAAEAYLNYLAMRPGVIDAYMFELRGDALFNTGDYANAMLDYQAAYKSPRLGSSFGIEMKMARTYAITGDNATAIVMYNDIYSRTDDDYLKAQTDLLLGRIYASIGQTDLAHAAYLDTVNLYPRAYDSYTALVELVNAGVTVDDYQRGLVDYYAGEYDVAIVAFDRYLQGTPVNPAAAYYFKGQASRSLGNATLAIEAWDKIIQNYPNSEFWDDAWEWKADTQWVDLDRYTDAEQTLLDFVATAPSHSRASEFLFDAARVAERDGQLTSAVEIWERVAVEYPTGGYAFRALFLAGIAYYRMGDYALAEKTFLRSHNHVPTNSDSAAVYLWIGKCQKASGDHTAARLTWEQAARIDPTGYYSERALDLIAGREPFALPNNLDLGYDLETERNEAEAWLRETFVLPAETDLSAPGLLANDPRFQRGTEYWRLGLYDQARLEFESLRQAVEIDAADTYRLMNYYFEIGLYRSAILAARRVLDLAGLDDASTLNAPIYFNHIRFGTYYSTLVRPAAESYGFHPLLVWSIIRQESFFEGFIRSSAGARGLMQIMPATGQTIADQLGWPPAFTAEDLYRPLVSLNLGVEYLDQQRAYLGDLYAALASYNAGPGNAAIWRDLAPNDPDLYLEVIRLEEPRRYIKNIYEMYSIYKRFYDRTP